MFGVVSHYGKVVFARCDADEQVEIFNGLANGLQPNLLAVRPARIRAMISSVVRSSSAHPPKNWSISFATRSRRAASVSVTLSAKRRDKARRSLGESRWAFAHTLSIDMPIIAMFYCSLGAKLQLFFAISYRFGR